MQSFEEYLLSRFREKALCSREDILQRIEKTQALIKEQSCEGTTLKGYYESQSLLFQKLYEAVEMSELFDAPEGWWHFTIDYDCYGVKLRLNKERLIEGFIYEDDFENNYDIFGNITFNTELVDQYTLFEISSELLTVEAYAKRYDVREVTIRQWIRRGKIRSAVKVGSEWRIPELAPTPNSERGYKDANYRWNVEIDDVPSGYEFINRYRSVRIHQLPSDKKLFELEFVKGNDRYGILRNTVEKERFELFLISRPEVKSSDDGFRIETK